MREAEIIEKVGMVASVSLPLFNIPLVLKIIQRKSSEDLSLSWAIGVWVCILFMTPQALRSNDAAFRAFGASNLLLFSAVVFFILKYRRRPGSAKGSSSR